MGRTGSRSAFGIWAVLILALSLSVLSSLSWGACTSYNDYYLGYCWTGGCNPNYSSCVTGSNNGKPYPCRYDGQYWRGEIYGKCGQNGAQTWTYQYITGSCCSSQAEADSAYCALNPTAEQCKSTDPSECTTAECCNEFNQGNVPVDTGFVGCAPPADGSQACQVSGSSAVCSGQSIYSLCTQQYLWNKQTKQCAPVATNNCIEVFRNDDMCTDVSCNSYTETQVVGMQFNPSTKCYHGKYREITHMECSNGNRGQVDEGPLQDYMVCESYLDSLGVSITESTGTPSEILITQYVAGDYPGGESVDGEGNTVTNSPGGQTGGTSTTQQQVVTRDSSGTTVVVKASDGSDSTAFVTTFNPVRCLGCSNGYCSLTNGSTSWSCEARSCSAALMSYNMNGGVCSANYNEYYNQPQGASNNFFQGDTASKMALTDSVIDYTAQLNRINKNLEDFMLGNGSPYGFFSQMEAMQAVVLNTSAEQLRSDTALTRLIMVKMDSMQSAVNLAINLHAGRMEDALGSASSQISGLFGEQNGVIASAAFGVQSAVNNASGNIVSAVHGTTAAVNSASSQNLTVMQGLMSAMGENTQFINSVDSKVGILVGQVSQANDMRYNFYAYMHDTLQTDLGVTLRGALDYNSDNIIVPAIETQTDAIVGALEGLQVDVSHDSVVDTISMKMDTLSRKMGYNATLSASVENDTVDFLQYAKDAYNENVVDSSAYVVDTSLNDSIRNGRWVTGGVFDDTASTFTDSVENTMQAKIDSTSALRDLQSDSLVRAQRDSIMKYSGFDSSAAAVKNLFSGYADACPENCLNVDISLPAPGNITIPFKVDFATIICSNKLFGQYTVLDFVKAILRILTAIFCTFVILNLFVQKKGGKK